MTSRPSRAPLQARVQAHGAAIAYELDGRADAPVLVLAHGIGTGMRIWDVNVDALKQSFRVLRFDLRGHGRSSTPPGAYTVDMLAQDTMALLDYLQLGAVHFAGIDIGARIGLHLAWRYPNRLVRLIACAPDYQPAASTTAESADLLRAEGLDRVRAPMLVDWLTRDFREAHPQTVAQLSGLLRQVRVEGWIECSACLRQAPRPGATMTPRIPTLMSPPTSSHLAHIENAEWFNNLVRGFLLDAPSGVAHAFMKEVRCE